jgi:hypothetical protein
MFTTLSLNAMLQRKIQNEVPDSVLRNQCPAENRDLIEHLLRLAQAELVVLNLASTTIAVKCRKILIRSVLKGPCPSVLLTCMRGLQAYSSARDSQFHRLSRRAQSGNLCCSSSFLASCSATCRMEHERTILKVVSSCILV